MVVVGVADQHDVRLEPGAGEVRIDHRPGRVRKAGVDENRAVPSGDDVLAHEARSEVTLDAMDAFGDLSHSEKEERVASDP